VTVVNPVRSSRAFSRRNMFVLVARTPWHVDNDRRAPRASGLGGLKRSHRDSPCTPRRSRRLLRVRISTMILLAAMSTFRAATTNRRPPTWQNSFQTMWSTSRSDQSGKVSSSSATRGSRSPCKSSCCAVMTKRHRVRRRGTNPTLCHHQRLPLPATPPYATSFSSCGACCGSDRGSVRSRS